MKDRLHYEKPHMEILDIDREDAILTSGAGGNTRPCVRERLTCYGYNYSDWCYDQ